MFRLSHIALFAVLTMVCTTTTAAAQFITPSLPADDQPLTRAEMVSALGQYFAVPTVSTGKDQLFFTDIWPADAAYQATAALCSKQILTCGGAFKGVEAASRESLLKIYYELRYADQGPAYIPNKYGNQGEWFLPYIIEGVKEGLINEKRTTGSITHKDFLSFLEHDAVSRFYQREVPYFEGLVASDDAITEARYHTLAEIEQIVQRYTLAQTTPGISAKVVTDLQARQKRFQELYEAIKANPLQHDPTYSDEWKAKFQQAGVKEVLGTGSYRFKTNEAYRKKNIVGTLEKMNGMVLQPDEEFDYWKVVKANGTEHIVSGWTLQGDSAVWAWGGGLCGSATTLFRTAWFAGLEITDRRPHSVYTTGYYPMKDIGLDASVFMPSPNLKFRNNTGAPVMLYFTSSTEPGYGTATFQVLGTKNFSSMTFPDLKRKGGYYIRERVIKFLDGTEKTDTIKSSYRRIH